MSNAPLRVFIGTDSRQPVAFNIAQASIWRHCSRPVSITPLILSQLPLKRRGLTDFTFSRYLVPYLCAYEGHALFVDADILCMGDIAELPWEAEESVSVVQHTEVSKNGSRVSIAFERPSVMLFNCYQSDLLTLEFVENGTPQKLESWAHSVRSLPADWNHLVGYDPPGPAKLAHFTMGIPIFKETEQDEYAAEYRAELERMNSTCSWAEIMGGSVHAKWKQPPPVNRFMRAQGFG